MGKAILTMAAQPQDSATPSPRFGAGHNTVRKVYKVYSVFASAVVTTPA